MPKYIAGAASGNAVHEVYLNGVKMDYVREADTDAGYIIRYVHDGKDFKLDDLGEEVLTERLEGAVTVATYPDEIGG